MSVDPQFPWWIVANAAGGIISGVAVAALKPVARFVARWRASKLSDKPHAERTREELEGMIAEFTATERAHITIKLLLDRGALSRETIPIERKNSGTLLCETVNRDAVFRYLCIRIFLLRELTRLRSTGFDYSLIPVFLYLAIIHPLILFQMARAPAGEPHDDLFLPFITKVIEAKIRRNPEHYRLSLGLDAAIKKFGEGGPAK
jgi:hypothetical protein